ncbi:MdtA/MuxA family multidrug efflux RND transporter periplasmic adaptor subunit [Paraburkholderia tropica]|uniref:MdtA/MuxA family multidrug efflux RND transporter periplasmic adaptor subunit n=1 Tax=Paraburkholderia tropica TaxID=92647 RepID=UPI0016022597|nr:MdtA/MuxA family multidrug efflux RND transporter periplasmic adaptor subunit [Paraburkholderia tropica]MBB2999842.1 multidrug efflux system membrane fusion protein [Paraburkholderia tropica]MBB6319473.1 multidrug efflux system membrane fusion protein [Paraburkholderia tropica]QNB11691.1 MdtA/MuxA family multidrug efflux RND transporter periplasmic adaptor subunit [Paraburkholderia tropica]
MDQQEKRPDSPRRDTPSATATPPSGEVRRRSRGKLIAFVIVLIVVLIVLLRWQPWSKTPNGGAAAPGGASGAHSRRGGPGAFANMPQPVSVATARAGDMPIVITALGTVTPLADVTVRTQLSGTLQSVNFEEGQMVKKGDVLAQIDPRPYQISLANAEGQLARDQALLATARLDLKRYQTLLAQDSIASQQVDTQASLVKQYEGTVKSDQANIDTYKLDLTYARITAPVSGRVGLRQVDPGNYVTSGDTNGIVVLTQLQPISVIFTTSEDNLPAIMKQMRAGTKLSVTAYDRSNTTMLEGGYLQTLDNQIDTTTGTVKLRASFKNDDESLFPNQFVNARLLVDTIHNAVIVPTSAVLNGSQGQYVYVVKPDNTVTVRVVKVGPIDAERTSIASGLAVGERVVIDGSDRLREGSKITIPAERPKHASGASGASGASWAGAASGAHRHRRHASEASSQ